MFISPLANTALLKRANQKPSCCFVAETSFHTAIVRILRCESYISLLTYVEGLATFIQGRPVTYLVSSKLTTGHLVLIVQCSRRKWSMDEIEDQLPPRCRGSSSWQNTSQVLLCKQQFSKQLNHSRLEAITNPEASPFLDSWNQQKIQDVLETEAVRKRLTCVK